MGELATLSIASFIFCKVRTFPDMLLVTVESFVAIPEYGEIAADSMARSHTDVREWTFVASAATVVGKMYTEGCTFRCRVVRERASVNVVGAVALKKVPADSDLGRIMLVHASETTTTGTCK
jgi:hypothetical protein